MATALSRFPDGLASVTELEQQFVRDFLPSHHGCFGRPRGGFSFASFAEHRLSAPHQPVGTTCHNKALRSQEDVQLRQLSASHEMLEQEASSSKSHSSQQTLTPVSGAVLEKLPGKCIPEAHRGIPVFAGANPSLLTWQAASQGDTWRFRREAKSCLGLASQKLPPEMQSVYVASTSSDNLYAPWRCAGETSRKVHPPSAPRASEGASESPPAPVGGGAMTCSFAVEDSNHCQDSSSHLHKRRKLLNAEAEQDWLGSTAAARGEPGDENAASEEGAEDDLDTANAKRLRRLVSNRASAKRSRQRKEGRIQKLEIEAAKLRVQHTELQRRLNLASAQLKAAEEEKAMLQERLHALSTNKCQ